jgi:putative membrane protein
MPTSGNLELAVKINQFPTDVKTLVNGWKQFKIDIDGQVVTLTLKPEVFRKLEQAQNNYSQWIATIVGKMTSKTNQGFRLKDCEVNVFYQSKHLRRSPKTKERESQSFLKSKENSQARSSPSKSGSKSNTFSNKYRLYTGGTLNWFALIIKLESSIFSDILPWIAFFTTYGCLMALLYNWGFIIAIPEESDAITRALLVFNIGLPSLLVFRTNTAHERFWEARKLWGQLVNIVRNLTRDICIVIKEDSPKSRTEKEKILMLVVAFAVAVKLHLRAEPVNDELASLMSETQYFRLKYTNHPPLQIAFWIGDYLQSQYDRNCLNVYQLTNLHQSVDTLVDILGGCERILKTPLPIVYALVLRKLVIVYCLLIPFEIVKDCHGYTSTIMAFVSMLLFSIEQIGSQLEQPFAQNPNNLPLDIICNTMLRNVEELIEYTPSAKNS